MFKIIFSHLASQSIHKPSITSKFNKWSIAKTDININRFESVLFFYKKELLNSRHNIRKITSNNYFIISEAVLMFIIISGFLFTILSLSLDFIILIRSTSILDACYYLIRKLFTNQIYFSFLLGIFLYLFLILITSKLKR